MSVSTSPIALESLNRAQGSVPDAELSDVETENPSLGTEYARIWVLVGKDQQSHEGDASDGEATLRDSELGLPAAAPSSDERRSAPRLDRGLGAGSRPRPVILRPFDPRPRPTVHLLAEWEGVVLGVGEELFTARLMSRTSDTPDEEVELPLAEVSDFDHDLVVEGGIFYLSIGYRVEPAGQRSRVGMIRFRRLPAWSATDIAEAQREASERMKALGWADGSIEAG